MAAAGQEVEGLTRDLEAAKAAYAEGSAEASKAAHDGGAKRSPEEHSNTPSEFIKVRLSHFGSHHQRRKCHRRAGLAARGAADGLSPRL